MKWDFKYMCPSMSHMGYYTDDENKYNINIVPIVGGGYRLGHNFAGEYNPQVEQLSGELDVKQRKEILRKYIADFVQSKNLENNKE